MPEVCFIYILEPEAVYRLRFYFDYFIEYPQLLDQPYTS